jgi:DNA-binding MarR family transcriptional regulator
MVVKFNIVTTDQLDLAHLALFVGQRVNELVVSRLAKMGFDRVRESHGYLIQHLIGGERSITELAKRMEVTQQAASKAVNELVNLGVLESVTAKDRRAKRIRLSRRGWECVRLTRHVRAGFDKRLMAAVGKTTYGRTKAALNDCLEELGGLERILHRRVRAPQ